MADVLLNVKVDTKDANKVSVFAKEFDKLGDSADKAKPKISGVEREINSFGSSMAKAFGFGAGFSVGAKFAETLVAGLQAIPQAALAAAAGVAELAVRGSEVAALSTSFEKLAAGAGQSGQELLAETRRMSQGLVSDMDIMAAANKGFLLGLPITAKEMGVLANTAVSLGQAMRVGPKEALADLITGLGRGSAAILDNLGITVKAEEEYKKYAAAHHTTVDALTESEKKLAIYNAAMQAAGQATETVGGIQLNAAQRVQQLEVAWENLRDRVAMAIAQSPELNQLLADVATGVANIATAVAEKAPQIAAFFDTLISEVRDAVSELQILLKIIDEHTGKKSSAAGTVAGLGAYVLDRVIGGGAGAVASGLAGLELAKIDAIVQRALEDAVIKGIGTPGQGKTKPKPPAPAQVKAVKNRMDAQVNEYFKYLDDIALVWMKAPVRNRWLTVPRKSPAGPLFDPNAINWGPGGEAGFDERAAGMKFWSRYKDVQDELNKNGGHLFPQESVKDAQALKDALSDVAQALVVIGDSIGGWAGATVSAIGFAAAAWGRYKSAVTTAQKVQAAAQAAQTAFDIYQQNKYNRSAAGGAMSGASQGAAAGAAFGPYGIVIGAVVGGIIGALSGSGFRNAAKQAGQTLGIYVSDELAKSILKMSKEKGISVQVASLLSLDKAMQEGMGKGLSAGSFAPQVIALIAGITANAIPAKEGIEQIGKAWQAMANEAGEGRVTKEMLAIMAAAKAAELQIKELSEFIKGLATKAAPVLEAAWKTVGQATEANIASVERLGRLTAGAFQAMVEAGVDILQIFETLGPAIDAAVAAYERLGMPIPDVLANVVQLRDFVNANKDLAAAMAGWGAVIQLAAAGFGDLKDAIAEVNNQIAQAEAGGLMHAQALYLSRDALREIDYLYRNGMLPDLDEATKKHLEEARAAGLLDPTPQERMATAMDNMVGLMGLLAIAFGVTLPAEMQKTIDKWIELNRTASNTPVPGGGGGGGGGDGGDGRRNRGEGFAVGFGAGGRAGWQLGPGLLARDTIFQAHAGEHVWVVPKGQRVAFRSAAKGFPDDGGGDGDIGPGGGGGVAGGGGAGGTDSGGAPDSDGGDTTGSSGGVPATVANEIRELTAAVASLTEIAARPATVTVESKPTIVVQDNSLVKTRDSVEEFNRTTLSLVDRALRLNTNGLASRVRAIAKGEL